MGSMKSAATKPRGRRVVAASKNSALVINRRRQLVGAAIEVFAQKGFHATTVRDIGRVSGLTQGTIYNYVRSKEDILFLVCDRIVTEYHDSVRRALAVEGDAIARVKAALRGIVGVMHEHQDTILLLYHESHNLDRRSLRTILAQVHEFIESFQQLLAEASADTRLHIKDVRLSANIVTYLPTMLALRRWALPKDLTSEQIIDETVSFMLRGLGIADKRPSRTFALRGETVRA
jgi:AcrR family transcriptional regulator